MNRAKRLLISMIALLCCTGVWASSIPGALSGRFTINASGEKVVFSQGNLQYVGTWQFAENQWDCFSTSQYNDHRDLFGWGTGDAPNKVSDNDDYGTFTDWGTNAITNGGNTENSGWRTLTKDEWVYLFYSRENAATLFGFGRVNDKNGLIILPDNWTTPEGASFTASTTLGLANLGSYYHNDKNDNYTHNTYTAEQWAVMESAGAVFLPAAAYRHGEDSNIYFTGWGGFYWSSTPSSTDKAYYLNFYSNDLDPQFNDMRYGGRPVRLVRSSLEKDGEGNHLLSSAQDWKDFAAIVNSGTNPAANAKMTADIDLGNDQTMVGTSSVPYQGSFDGQGHTLKVAYNTSESTIAPFRYVAGSTQTIENLHVNGTIYTTGCAAGGVVCSIAGNLTIKKCWVSAQIRTQNAGGSYGTIGGICSYCDPTENCTIVIEDCLFSGAILYSSYCGSFMSHVASSKSSVTIRRGLSIGTWSGGNGYQSGTFIRPVLNGIRNIENAFYRYSCGEVQGTHATDEELADGTIATALQNGRAEEIWVQDPVTNQPMLKLFATKAYTVPASGIGTFSAKAKFTVPDGLTAHYCKTYDKENGTIGVVDIDGAVPANTGVLLKGTPGETYTLTGTNSDAATVEGNALVAVTEATHVNQVSGDYTNFMMSDGQFIKIEASDDPNVKMPANRAYLKILTSELPSDPLLARGITLSWDDDATSISEMEKWRNGENEKFYDLQGRLIVNGKLSNGKLPKGLYINNGRKVVIK